MEHLYADHFYYLGLIPLMPLIGAIINGIVGAKLPRKLVHWIACTAMGLAFMFSVLSIRALVENATHVGNVTHYGHLTYTAYNWIFAGHLGLNLGFLLDPLSSVMILIVTGVGFLIHVYSIGYMEHDPAKWRFFAYLNLFIFAMLLLVLGENIIVTFIGWEGVGLCSYLLIGFWYDDDDKAYAGQKAFIANRVGDFAFLLGVFILFNTTGTFNYLQLAHMATHASTVVRLIPIALPVTLLIFVGCTGKSAQIPLYVWLPDAMAGPTPVSALIHAATMVTAGVFLISRLNWLFTLDPRVMLVVASIGTLTAFVAATIAIVQNDIKKVLAYSTISQLGYMFMAVGVGAFTAGIFHLMTHAFFKALLFLGAGSVIHGMHEEQDIRKMGGLKKHMPITRWTFLVATLAISGIPFFSGFFSKDDILWHSLANTHLLDVKGVMAHGVNIAYMTHTMLPGIAKGDGLHVLTYAKVFSTVFYVGGVVTAALTAFYMFRLYFLTFEGECRAPKEIQEKIHESPDSMALPLIALAILAAIGGYIGLPDFVVHALHLGDWSQGLDHWLSGVFQTSDTFRIANRFGDHTDSLELICTAISTVLALSGAGAAWFLYLKRPELPKELAERLQLLYKWTLNKYFVDEFYNKVFVHGAYLVGVGFYWFDRYIIDGLIVDGVGYVAEVGGRILRSLQSGYVQRYATYITLAIVLALFALMYPGCF